MITIREINRHELQDIWKIDRSEVIHNTYSVERGELVLKPDYFDAKGWPPGEAECYGPILLDCFDRGAAFYGAFDGARLVGAAVLECKFIGQPSDQLQLVFLHVDCRYRNRGLGKTLFEKAVEKAKQLGAKRLYISATPSENTVRFYLRLGCVVTNEINPELFALEPDDVHLEYRIP